jgi:hypothetical protein
MSGDFRGTFSSLLSFAWLRLDQQRNAEPRRGPSGAAIMTRTTEMRLLNTDEAAIHCRVSPGTLEKWR